jgi:hypothetical protein
MVQTSKLYVQAHFNGTFRGPNVSLANWYGFRIQRNVTLPHRSKTTIRQPHGRRKSRQPGMSLDGVRDVHRSDVVISRSRTRCPGTNTAEIVAPAVENTTQGREPDRCAE